MPRNITIILRIETIIQDFCVKVILQRSRDLAITTLTVDPNMGSFDMAEKSI